MSRDYVTADWAKEKSERWTDMSRAEDDQWLSHILRRIEDAAHSGRFYIEMNLRSPTDVLYNFLRERGFTVTVVLYQRDGEWTRVSW